MKTNITLILFLCFTIFVNAQDIELCRDGDSLEIRTSSPVNLNLYQDIPDCASRKSQAQCANSAGYCFWELGESCVLSEQITPFTPQDPLLLTDICSGLSENECNEKSFIRCVFENSECTVSRGFQRVDQIILDSVINKIELPESGYTYFLTDSEINGFDFRANDVTECSLISGIENEKSHQEIKIYPNPSSGLFFLEFFDVLGSYEIEVLDALGQVSYSYSGESITNSAQLSLEDLPSGQYYISVKTSSRSYGSKLTIK